MLRRHRIALCTALSPLGLCAAQASIGRLLPRARYRHHGILAPSQRTQDGRRNPQQDGRPLQQDPAAADDSLECADGLHHHPKVITD